MNTNKFTCIKCSKQACNNNIESEYPKLCPTKQIAENDLERIRKMYEDDDSIDSILTKAAIQIDSDYYCQYTRMEEIVAFAHQIGAEKIGVAYCIALAKEAKVFAKYAEKNNLEVYGAICKIGAIDKTEIGIDEEVKHSPGKHESICNPVLQAEYLEKKGVRLIVLIGLCVGHDSILCRHANIPVTTLAVKDRVLCHNPLGAIYSADTFYDHKLSDVKWK